MKRLHKALLTSWAGGFTYTQKVQGTATANLIAYWPMAEASGTTALDESGNGRNGAYSNVTLGVAGIGDGRTAASFNGTTSVMNGFAAGLAAAVNGSEGTLAGWAKVSGAGVWTDGAVRRMARIFADANNDIVNYRDSTNNRLVGFYRAGGTIKTRNVEPISTIDWFHFAIVWSKAGDYIRVYMNGVQQGADVVALGVWAGVPTIITVGAGTAAPIQVWSGDLAHWAIWTTPLSSTQVANLATV